jgi:hypothetical protein
LDTTAEPFDPSVVARFKNHSDAEEAVCRLERAGIPLRHVSTIGRDFPLRDDVQGCYCPSDLIYEGVDRGAWVGGSFGSLMGFGLFFMPVVGPVVALGALARRIAGAVAGAGIGARVSGLMALGVSKEDALKYQARIQAGEFLVMVLGPQEEVGRARAVSQYTNNHEVTTHERERGTTPLPPPPVPTPTPLPV